MGAIRKVIACVFVAAALLPTTGAHAATLTMGPPYLDGPRAGDQYNFYSQDDTSGSLTVLRYSLNPPVSGGLGCGGNGGLSYFEVDLANVPASLSSVVVHYTQPLVDPYTFVHVEVRQDGHDINTQEDRGIIFQDGATTVPVSLTNTDPIQVWFGFDVSSACPNVDGGHAVFTSVDFNS
ncbi:MAG: hypothetical protein ACYDCC_06055 [Actinomycetota bacterium]